MQQHRFAEQFMNSTSPVARMSAGCDPCQLASLAGMVSASPSTLAVWQAIYQAAYERTQAVLAPSRLETYFRPFDN